MEVEASIRLFSGTRLGFILLLSGAVAMYRGEIYTVLNSTVLLDVPECRVSDFGSANWQEGKTPLVKWRKDENPSFHGSCTPSTCRLHQNGSLLLHRPNAHTTQYTLTVYSSDGTQTCKESRNVTVQDALEQPVVGYDCSSKGDAVVRCSTSFKSSSNLTLSWGSSSFTTSEKSMTKNTKEKNVNVTCIVQNRASHRTASLTVSCPGLFSDLYLIVSIVGGAVAFIIFCALVFYSVKFKPWRSHSSSEGDAEAIRPQRQRPPGQNIGLLSGSSQGDFPAHISIQKPPAPYIEGPQEPRSSKGKKSRGRPPPPQAPGETAAMYLTPPAPHQDTPALPGNHPSEKAPRPQPRTNSKEPRQNRKHCR